MAVYTRISLEEAAAFARAHDPALAVVGMEGAPRGVENTIYFLRAADGRALVLTIYERRTRVEDLPFFLGLMNHLAARGLRCPQALAVDGALFGQMRGKPASLSTFLVGASPEKPQPAHCAQAGATLARLHLAAGDYPARRANALGTDAWGPLAARCLDDAEAAWPRLAEAAREELAFVAEAWPQDLERGVIHADFFPDNTLFAEGQPPAALDFCFACNDLIAYDLAIALNAWCFEADGAFNITKARALTRAYHALRPLSSTERARLPALCRGAALRFMLTRLHDALYPQEGEAPAKPPEDYFMRLMFHRRARSAVSYGLDA